MDIGFCRLEWKAEGSGYLARQIGTRFQGGPSGPLFVWAGGQHCAGLFFVRLPTSKRVAAVAPVSVASAALVWAAVLVLAVAPEVLARSLALPHLI